MNNNVQIIVVLIVLGVLAVGYYFYTHNGVYIEGAQTESMRTSEEQTGDFSEDMVELDSDLDALEQDSATIDASIEESAQLEN